MSSIWTGLCKRSSFESNALLEKSFLQDCTRWLEATFPVLLSLSYGMFFG